MTFDLSKSEGSKNIEYPYLNHHSSGGCSMAAASARLKRRPAAYIAAASAAEDETHLSTQGKQIFLSRPLAATASTAAASSAAATDRFKNSIKLKVTSPSSLSSTSEKVKTSSSTQINSRFKLLAPLQKKDETSSKKEPSFHTSYSPPQHQQRSHQLLSLPATVSKPQKKEESLFVVGCQFLEVESPLLRLACLENS